VTDKPFVFNDVHAKLVGMTMQENGSTLVKLRIDLEHEIDAVTMAAFLRQNVVLSGKRTLPDSEIPGQTGFDDGK
jgi:hypothetical protein